jgi:uncharacterized OsmC-like protein
LQGSYEKESKLTLITNELKQGVKKLHDELSSLEDLTKATRPTVAVAKMVGPQASEATWGDNNNLSVRSDEGTSIGGGNTGPSPSAIFTASIGFAENVLFARHAAMQNVDFDSLETKVEASWDRKGLFLLDGKDPSIFMINIETRIGTNAPSEKMVELLKLTHKTSPMTATLAKVATIHRKLLVNGNEVKI